MTQNLFDSLPIELTKFITELCEPETLLIFSRTCHFFYQCFNTTASIWSMADFCAKNGFLSLLKWIYLDGYISSLSIMETAITRGDLEMVRWFTAHWPDWEYRKSSIRVQFLYSRAAKEGHLHILKWFKSEGCPLRAEICYEAAKGSHHKLLKWAITSGCPWHHRTAEYLVVSGNLDMLKWAIENNCPWNCSTFGSAVRKGLFEIAKWAKENKCPFAINDNACFYAAFYNNLDFLIWARENGFYWDTYVCCIAAKLGHFELLKWARTNGCPWEETTCFVAVAYGYLEILIWCIANGCPWDKQDCFRFAKKCGNLEIINWIEQN